MFSGIVEETGRVVSLTATPRSVRLAIASRALTRVPVGGSVAINGVCLTVAACRRGARQFDVLRETMRRTNLRFLRAGDTVNLERSLKLGTRLGGHFVTGHVDAVGRIRRWEKRGRDYFLEITAPQSVMNLTLRKGSIAVDGISLTVAEVKPRSFSAWIIPHTRAVTNLRARKIGDAVNLEADVLGKYAQKFLAKTGHRR